jgi:ribosomal protein S12 methylthiotransferase accessory factor YcaO
VSTQEPESVARLQGLLERLEKARTQLEATEDPEQAVDVLQSLTDLAKEIQAEIEHARREGPPANPPTSSASSSTPRSIACR